MDGKFIDKIQKFLTFLFNIEILKVKPRHCLRYAKEYFKNKSIIIVEIGTYRGEHALQILKTLNIKKLYLIDPWKEYKQYKENEKTQKKLDDALKKCKKRLKKYEGKITYIKEFSNKAVNRILEKVDFVYIDGNHDYKYVKEDMKLYFSKLKEKGILAGHDLSCPSVAKAFVEFIYENKLPPFISKRVDWWTIK